MSVDALSLSGVGLTLEGNTILRDIRFSVPEGEFVSVIGPNGAGKTSLLKCINRIYRATAGRIAVHGADQTGLSQRALAQNIGYVPQGGGSDASFTVYEFVLFARYAHLGPFAPPGKEDEAAATEALAELEMQAFAQRAMSTLSGGERQLVLLASAIAQGASILLLDEAASFLDYRHQVAIRARLDALHRERGITIVSVTHDVSQAIAQSDRIIALVDGSLRFDGTPEALLAGDELEAIYDTRFHRADGPDGVVLTPIPGDTGT